VLASDEESASLDALRFSLASDIVELVVLTADEAFLQTLREAIGTSRRLWHVPSADKVSDLLVAGGVGILVVDVPGLGQTPTVFIGQIKRQFPDLVVLVAGNRDAEISLAGSISAGTVYRFIHKPLSPARAKLFTDVAVKRYNEQRRTAATPRAQPKARSNSAPLIGTTLIIAAAAAAAAIVFWISHRNAEGAGDAPARQPAAVRSDPPLDSHPADPLVRAGLAEVHERLLSKAENALLEEHLDEAAASIETARRSGVESGRIAFLTAQLAKLREHVKTAQAKASERTENKPGEDKITLIMGLAAQRISESRLIEPEGDSALFYIQEALLLDPNNGAAQDAERALAMRLLTEAHAAIDRRDFARASAWLNAAKGVAAAANIDAARQLLETARRQADVDAWTALLKNAGERLQQDRLVEPANDSAKYYLLTLRGLDPGNAGLGAAMQELGARLVAKGRRALALEQYDAARSWLEEAAGIGFASPDADSVRRDLDAAVSAQQFADNVVAAGNLALLKSVRPRYPAKAEFAKAEGWVELDFTVTETGAVKDIAVHAASTPGVFEEAAISALSQWRYKPVVRDARAVAQRARIRIRFALDG